MAKVRVALGTAISTAVVGAGPAAAACTTTSHKAYPPSIPAYPGQVEGNYNTHNLVNWYGNREYFAWEANGAGSLIFASDIPAGSSVLAGHAGATSWYGLTGLRNQTGGAMTGWFFTDKAHC